MPTYEIEQYEVHTMKYRGEADNEAEAIKMMLAGEADPVDNGFDFIEVCEDLGLPADQYRELVEQLRSLGIFSQRTRHSLDSQRWACVGHR